VIFIFFYTLLYHCETVQKDKLIYKKVNYHNELNIIVKKMAKLKSKQISDFNPNVVWSAATATEIPNSKDIQNNFLPEAAMVIEDFSGNSITSSTGSWQLVLSSNVQNNDLDLVTIFVNGVKTNGVISVNGTIVTIHQYAYDIEADDILEVHYIKEHTIA
jgi:hypothetical protein